MGLNEQNQHFTELRLKVGIYKYADVTAPNRFAKFGLHPSTFCNRRDEKRPANLRLDRL